MSLIGSFRGGIGKVLKGLDAVPGLARLRVFGRFTGVAGLIIRIGASAIESVTSLSLMPFLQEFALNLVRVNKGLVVDVKALQAGASGLGFWWHTMGIYSKIWFVVFVTGLISTYLKNVHFGDQVPKYQLQLVTFAVILTPLQLIGAVIANVVQTGALERSELFKVITPWRGIRMVATNTDIWLQPSLNAVSSFPGISSPTGVENETLNQSVKNIQSIGG